MPTHKTCEYCKGSFITRDKRQKFCSKKCCTDSNVVPPREMTCKHCGTKSFTKDNAKIFCNSKCSTLYNNANRGPISDITRERMRSSILNAYATGKLKRMSPAAATQLAIEGTKGKFKEPTSILEVSKRTASKICDRLFKACFICGWDEASCDIHHIRGRKIPDPHNHNNLSYLCPNHHRLADYKLIDLSTIPTIEQKFGDKWKEFYYG